MPFTARTRVGAVTGHAYHLAWHARSSRGLPVACQLAVCFQWQPLSVLLKASPPVKRVCALDLGAARVGVAISDDLGLMAHPRGVLAARPRPKLLDTLRELVRAEEIVRIVVGFPLDMRGTEGEAARRARQIAQQIADATACDVELFDERLSTVQAQRALAASEVFGQKAKARIDEAAAVEILQAWLDARAARRKRAKR